ncbi:MAG: LysR substrate-binding domain-containing protein [Methylococcales bacterium]|nr:LysR substrate-binding domain-containing protein [Methylococcales bacterium]
MNFTQFELLRLLQETGFNQSKAATRLHLVQSAVSRQLQLLEEELGSPLFERQGKKLLGLTPLGERVLVQVERISLAKQNIQAIAADARDSGNGSLRIATTHTQAKYLLPEPIQKFREKYPGVSIYMIQSSPDDIIQLLHHHRADIAICTERLSEDSKLIVRPCYEWRHIAIVPHRHPLAKGVLSLERLASFPVLTYSPGFTGRSTIGKAFGNAGLTLDVALSAADSDVIKTYVRLGLGVGVIAGTAYEPGNDGDLVALDLAQLIPGSQTKIAYLKHLYLPACLEYFIRELLKGEGKDS